MTCTCEGALGCDWCGAPPLVWVELVPPPLWLEPAAVVDMLTSCSWNSGMLSKVGCSTSSAMVGRIEWVDGEEGFGFGRTFVVCLRLGGDVDWFILVASSGLSSGLEHGRCQMLPMGV
jgi:hypothetical protein